MSTSTATTTANVSSHPKTDDNTAVIIIFDWDDTILPSSFVDKSNFDNISELPPAMRATFREIEVCTEKCLAAAACHGEVIIITNSDEGWVKYSAERWLPNLIPILANYRIISARTRYEKFYPNQPLCWKAAAFAHEANEHFCALEDARALLERECSHRLLSTSTTTSSSAYSSPGVVSDGESIQDIDMASTDVSSHMTGENDDSSLEEELDSPGAMSAGEGERWVGEVVSPLPSSYTTTTTSEPSTLPQSMKREIVSFGDSIEERTAVRIVSDQLDATPKSVKFLTNPTPNQIIGQLVMLTHHMTYVGEYKSDLDLEISSRQAEKCALGYLHRRGLVTSALAATNNTMTTPQQSSMHASFF